MINGFVNVYKEQGYTSFDVVAKLRGILKQKKIGHTGTLDPLAEGVLLVCLGNATKMCDLLTEKNKSYTCVMLLGKTTDTEDITGKVLTENNNIPDEETVKSAIMSFVGDYQQLPPMYSAIKVNGKKLYELARQGIEVQREKRPVTIHRIEIEKTTLPRVTFRVSCSKGTYIRSLCRDIGEQLGCGAVMEQLVRTEVKGFAIKDSLKLSELERARDEGNLMEHIIPTDMLMKDLPALHVNETSMKLLLNGNKLAPSDFEENEIIDGKNVRVYDAEGEFKALYAYDNDKGQYVPFKMFLS
ncbi:MAG: tRNA pseudouridine(55) synthase TruB [Coprococcus sp.]|nr:tRNA pseudouridine(55) synthase TruB [Coprococcus sp.]